MKRALFLFLIFSILIGCKEKSNKHYDKLILGEWKFLKIHRNAPLKIQEQKDGEDVPPPPPPFTFREWQGGCQFMVNNVFEDKVGFLKRIREVSEEGDKSIFLGTTTKYVVEGDSLKIYNLNIRKWISEKIFSITKDTLTLQERDSSLRLFVRMHYPDNKNEHFDQIIVSSSGCFGTCPINNILIDKSGEMICHCVRYNTVNGYFRSKISREQFEKIESNFRKANFLELENNYSASHTDDEAITVSFIKDNKLIKTIRDYGGEAPIELWWAYTPVRYVCQQVHLDSILNIPTYLIHHGFRFKEGKKVLCLKQSEGFYLWSLLLKSKTVQREFKPRYTVQSGQSSDMQTDGRYYKLEIKAGESVVLDLGFNFIEVNGLNEKFKGIDAAGNLETN